jgi:archaellum component FlaC
MHAHFSPNNSATNRFEDIQDQLNEFEEMLKSADAEAGNDSKRNTIFIQKTKQSLSRLKSLIASTPKPIPGTIESTEQQNHLLRIQMLLEKVENEITKFKTTQREQ